VICELYRLFVCLFRWSKFAPAVYKISDVKSVVCLDKMLGRTNSRQTWPYEPSTSRLSSTRSALRIFYLHQQKHKGSYTFPLFLKKRRELYCVSLIFMVSDHKNDFLFRISCAEQNSTSWYKRLSPFAFRAGLVQESDYKLCYGTKKGTEFRRIFLSWTGDVAKMGR
jgi:hypothetical protein